MTFVLATINNGRIFIFADTRISAGGLALQKSQGVIKTCFVSAGLAVSYSNSPELAARDINRFRSNHVGSGYAETIDYFAAASADTEVDYLLAFATPARLVKVTKGKVEKTIGSRSWLGDYEAFKRFRGFENGRPTGHPQSLWDVQLWGTNPQFSMGEKDTQAFVRTLAFFEAVLSDQDIVSVGDFCSVATNVNGKFQFLFRASLFFDQIEDGGGQAKMLAGSHENKMYRMSVLAPRIGNPTATGYYFPVASIAYIYTASDSSVVANQCEIIEGLGIDDLIKHCEQRFGIKFDFIEASH